MRALALFFSVVAGCTIPRNGLAPVRDAGPDAMDGEDAETDAPPEDVPPPDVPEDECDYDAFPNCCDFSFRLERTEDTYDMDHLPSQSDTRPMLVYPVTIPSGESYRIGCIEAGATTTDQPKIRFVVLEDALAINLASLTIRGASARRDSLDVLLEIPPADAEVGRPDIVVGAVKQSAAFGAIYLAGLEAGSTIEVVNYGQIVGAGGDGGDSGACDLVSTQGSDGGPGVYVGATQVTISNYGQIYGGGGGGGGSTSCDASGCPAGADRCCVPSGAGGGGAGIPAGDGGRTLEPPPGREECAAPLPLVSVDGEAGGRETGGDGGALTSTPPEGGDGGNLDEPGESGMSVDGSSTDVTGGGDPGEPIGIGTGFEDTYTYRCGPGESVSPPCPG